MKRKIWFFIGLWTILYIPQMQAQKFEGLANTPPMGWNSWNKFGCNIDENIIRGVADAMVENGLRDAGYVYVNVDDCWQIERDSLGFIVADPAKFPSGIKALTDYIHSRGLKMGIYSDACRKTCGGRPGSRGHEYQDAIQYAAWGIDYLKHDWCFPEDINAKGAYDLMRDALRAAGRPVYFSICEWGVSKPWEWAENAGHSWRTTNDIHCCFDGMWEGWSPCILQMIDLQDSLGVRKYAGPGHWNDPDMLEVGNGMTAGEDRAHFSMWCMLAAPLILGNDLRNMSQETKDIILNKDVIAINQDTLGVQGLKFASADGLDFWFKPLAGGDWAFCILNRTTIPKEYTIDWLEFDLYDDVSKRFTNFDSSVYDLYNLWSKQGEGNTTKPKKVTVAGHDVVMYRLNVRTTNQASKKKS